MPSKVQRTDGAGLMAEVENLRRCVTDMDRVSQSAFSEIACIAKLAIAQLETPACYRNIENIAVALEAIAGRAHDAQNVIHASAENVEAHFVNEAERRRLDAVRAALSDIRLGAL